MVNPKVSVIIPAYNAEKFVKEAVDSALAQTYPDCEVIVVNDGSTDGTENVLRPYIDARKIVYISQINKGLAGARNAGIRAARGEYIALLDSDDLFLPEKIARQLRALQEHSEYGVCYCDLLHFSDSRAPRQFYHHRYTYPSGDVFAPLLHKQFINPLAVFARRDVFEKYGYFDESLRRSEDWDLWLRLAHAGVKFFYLDEVLAHYRVHAGAGSGNLSSVESEPAMKQKNLELFERVGASLTEEEWHRYNYDAILEHLRLKLALAYLLVGDKPSALAHLKELPKFAVKILPASFLRAASRLALSIKHRSLLKKV